MRRRVLMIDDDADIREVTALSLETMANWEMLEASTGAEGIAKAERELPDLILLDLMMPDMDGKTTLEKLKSNAKTAAIPVMLLTAKMQAGDVDELKAIGLAGVLPKPFDPMTLCAEIAQALGWKIE